MSKYIDVQYNLNTKNKDIILSTDLEAIRNSIRNIVTISPYSIPGKPEFGADLPSYLFEPNDELTYDMIEDVIDEAIQRWEDRIIVNSYEINSDKNNNVLLIRMEILVILTNDIETVTIKVPF